MANQQPTVNKLQALITTLQAKVTTLQHAAPAAAQAQVVFVDMPQTLGVDNLIDYSTILGKDFYNQGCAALYDKALTNGFNMIPGETGVFTEACQCKADSMGWTKGTKHFFHAGRVGYTQLQPVKSRLPLYNLFL